MGCGCPDCSPAKLCPRAAGATFSPETDILRAAPQQGECADGPDHLKSFSWLQRKFFYYAFYYYVLLSLIFFPILYFLTLKRARFELFCKLLGLTFKIVSY